MRRKKLPNAKGIYEDIKSGRLQCQKRIKGKLYTETFDNVKQAKHWIKFFSPDSPVFEKITVDNYSDVNGRINASIEEVWSIYVIKHVNFIEKTSQEVSHNAGKFLKPIYHLNIRNITPHVISKLISSQKEVAMKCDKSKRCNFNSELRVAAAMFNWWRKHEDFTFSNPVIRTIHWPLGVIKKSGRNKSVKMELNIVRKFIQKMYEIENNPIYAMLAEVQFLTTSRIQDVSCIHASQVDFDNGILIIDKARAFTRTSKNQDYDKSTKNGESKVMELTERMRSIFATLINSKPVDCKYVFQIEGKPLTYRQIQYAYNKGLKSIGVYPEFSSTHIMRHASAYSVREMLSLDHAQAMGGWKSTKLAEHYSGLSSKLTGEGSKELESRLKIVQ